MGLFETLLGMEISTSRLVRQPNLPQSVVQVLNLGDARVFDSALRKLVEPVAIHCVSELPMDGSECLSGVFVELQEIAGAF